MSNMDCNGPVEPDQRALVAAISRFESNVARERGILDRVECILDRLRGAEPEGEGDAKEEQLCNGHLQRICQLNDEANYLANSIDERLDELESIV